MKELNTHTKTDQTVIWVLISAFAVGLIALFVLAGYWWYKRRWSLKDQIYKFSVLEDAEFDSNT